MSESSSPSDALPLAHSELLVTFDASIEGTEDQKNAFLSPALPVPALEREVAHAQGKAVGLGNVPPGPPLLDAPPEEDIQDS